MRNDGYWGTDLELFVFLNLMKLNINIYYIYYIYYIYFIDQEDQEFKIDHPQNTG